MLRKLHLELTQEAMILTATRASFKITEVSQAVRAILANAKGPNRASQKDTFVVAEDLPDQDASWDEDQEVLQVLAAELQENETYDEEELLDTYGPIRETPLTRAMRQDLSRLDAGRRANKRLTEAVQTELLTRRWTDKTKRWRISWQDGVLIRLHGQQHGPYRPCEKTCPVPLQWLTGKRYSLVKTEGVDGYSVITDDDYMQTRQFHPELKQWSGYSGFEIKMPELETEIPDGEREVYEVTVWVGLKKDTDMVLKESKRAEVEKLFKYKALKIIPPREAKQIRLKKGRILPSRFVITEKPDDKEPGKMKVKARWCVRGYLDPDLHKLEKQHLTGQRVDEGPLYIEPPPSGMPGVPSGSLLMAEKAIYGLADAPKAWRSTFDPKSHCYRTQTVVLGSVSFSLLA